MTSLIHVDEFALPYMLDYEIQDIIDRCDPDTEGDLLSSLETMLGERSEAAYWETQHLEPEEWS